MAPGALAYSAPGRGPSRGACGPIGMIETHDTLVRAPGGTSCTNCGARLAEDQRYCINCGERRGRPRFSVADLAEPAVETSLPAVATRRQRAVSSGTTLLASVATLLLALGVGVLIGHDTAGGTSASTPRVAASSSPINIHVGGSGSTGSSSGSSASKGHRSGSAKTKAHVSKTVVVKANAAAQKVTGGSAKLAPATVTTGAKGSGAGYQNGHFTGNFFGG